MSMNSDVCTCGDGVWTILLARPAGVGGVAGALEGRKGCFHFSHAII